MTPPSQEARALRVTVLGGFGVVADGRTVALRPVAGRLVRRLLVARGSCVPEEVLLECFWPERDPRAARNNLHVAVHHTRRRLGSRRLVRGDGTYRLALSPGDAVDCAEFEAAARAALSTPGPGRRPRMDAALALWGGEPLPEDRYADWASPLRAELQALRRAISLELAAAMCVEGRPAEAAIIVEMLVAEHPLDEAAACQLMTAWAASGRRAEALALYERLRADLRREWSIDVSGQTNEVAQAVCRDDEGALAARARPAAVAAFAPVRGSSSGSSRDLRTG